MGTLISGSTGIDKIQNDAVDIADLSATGTASASTFLRGDNSWTAVDALPTQSGNAGKFLTTDASTASWAEAGGGKIEQVVMGSNENQINSTSSSDDLVSQAITPSATSSSVLVTGTLFFGTGSNPNAGIILFRDSTALGATTTGQYGNSTADSCFWSSDNYFSATANQHTIQSLNFTFLDTGISTTSATTYKFSTSNWSSLVFNRCHASNAGFARSTIILMEVLA
jgi:hypothetical protein